MRVIVAGSRTINDYDLVANSIAESSYDLTMIVSGAARGVDQLGEQWAQEHNVTIKQFPAKWYLHSRAAGPIRNRDMANFADALIAIWDGKSRGTLNMITQMRALGKPVFIHDTSAAKAIR